MRTLRICEGCENIIHKNPLGGACCKKGFSIRYKTVDRKKVMGRLNVLRSPNGDDVSFGGPPKEILLMVSEYCDNPEQPVVTYSAMIDMMIIPSKIPKNYDPFISREEYKRYVKERNNPSAVFQVRRPAGLLSSAAIDLILTPGDA